MTKRERERKIKMFGMIGMSLLTIASLATATYAWFTKIVATVNTGTMTVSTVEETTWKFYAYNGNLNENYASKGVFSQDFEEINHDNKATLATAAGLFAGDAVIFAIEVTGMEGTSYNISLDLTAVTSNTIGAQKGDYSYHRYARKTVETVTTVREVNVGWAMDIYTCGGSTNDVYLDDEVWSDDKYLHTFENTQTFVVDDSTNKKNLYATTSPVAPGENNNYFIFYKVYFTDDPTSHFTETDSQYSKPETYPQTDSVLRYFDYDEENGNSNLYAGLTFNLKNLSLNVNAAAS